MVTSSTHRRRTTRHLSRAAPHCTTGKEEAGELGELTCRRNSAGWLQLAGRSIVVALSPSLCSTAAISPRLEHRPSQLHPSQHEAAVALAAVARAGTGAAAVRMHGQRAGAASAICHSSGRGGERRHSGARWLGGVAGGRSGSGGGGGSGGAARRGCVQHRSRVGRGAEQRGLLPPLLPARSLHPHRLHRERRRVPSRVERAGAAGRLRRRGGVRGLGQHVLARATRRALPRLRGRGAGARVGTRGARGSDELLLRRPRRPQRVARCRGAAESRGGAAAAAPAAAAEARVRRC